MNSYLSWPIITDKLERHLASTCMLAIRPCTGGFDRCTPVLRRDYSRKGTLWLSPLTSRGHLSPRDVWALPITCLHAQRAARVRLSSHIAMEQLSSSVRVYYTTFEIKSTSRFLKKCQNQHSIGALPATFFVMERYVLGKVVVGPQ